MTVAVRCRPLMPREQRDGAESVVALEDRRVAVGDPVELAARGSSPILGRNFAFDLVLGGDSQSQVHETLGVPLLRHAWRGLNASIFAYGQTGSGKTYSMTGGDGDARGIIPRVCEGLWDAADAHSSTHETTVEASYMEVYNERVRDLLVPTGRPLKVREHPTKGACVPELTVVRVRGRNELAELLAVGSDARATAATRGNARSSRSHAVVSLVVSRRRRSGSSDAVTEDGWWSDLDAPSSSTSTIRLVDLAGSERVAVTGTDGARLQEAKAINKSLAALCDVVSALAANSRKKKAFVPYRNSALTWLLKDSLGGNAHAAMLATVSPSDRHFEETVATLKYAFRARRVKCRATVNLVEDLPEEVLPSPPSPAVVVRRSSPRRSPQQPKQVRWPRLTNLNPDPAFAGAAWAPIRDGATVLGCTQEADCVVRGSGVAPRHAVVCCSSAQGVVVLCALPGAETHVDGNRVAMDEREATRLEHGSRVVLARRLAFRYEARQDESLDAFDATDAWHAAIAEVSQKGSGAFADEFRGLSQLDDEEASQPARAASPDPPEYTTARAPDPVPRVVVGGGPSPRKSAPRPLTPPRSEALGDADLDDLAAAQAQLDAILGAPPAYVASRQ